MVKYTCDKCGHDNSPKCGTMSKYSMGCKCDLCKGSHRQYSKARDWAKRNPDKWRSYHLGMKIKVGEDRGVITHFNGYSLKAKFGEEIRQVYLNQIEPIGDETRV